MKLFPFFMDIEGKKILIAGGGRAAAQKAAAFEKFSDCIRVVAPQTDISAAEVEKRALERRDIEEADIVVCATSEKDVNAGAAALCREKNIPVNVVDDPANSDFIFPAIVKRGDICIAITTNGKSPALAGALRRWIEKRLPKDLEETLRVMEKEGKRMRAEGLPLEKRRQLLGKLADEMLGE